jgi:hypothetical protein
MISSSLHLFPEIKYSENESNIADNLVSLYLSKQKNKSSKGKLKLMNVMSISTAIAFKAPTSLIISIPLVLSMSFAEMSREANIELGEKKIKLCIVKYLEDYNNEIKTNKEKAEKNLDVISLAQQVVDISKSHFSAK